MMYKIKSRALYLTLSFSFSYILCTKSSLAPTHLMVTRAGPCEDGRQLKVTVSELSITTQTYDSSLSGTVHVDEEIKDGWKVKVTIEKCMDLRNTDSCDYFKSFYVVKNGCNASDDDEQDIYGMLFHYVEPRIECPIPPGTYKLLNYPFFTEENYNTVYESKISTSVFGYVYRLDGYSASRKKILCLEVFLQLIYVRTHDWEQNFDALTTTTLFPVIKNRKDKIEIDKLYDSREY